MCRARPAVDADVPACLFDEAVDYQFGTPESDYASATGAGGKVVIVGDTPTP